MNDNRTKILSVIYNVNNNRIMRHVLNKQWYIDNNQIEIWNLIHTETSFLNECSILERLFYIRKDLFETKKCSFCNDDLRVLGFGKNAKFSKVCNNKECKNKFHSQLSFQRNKNLSDIARENKRMKCCKKRGSYIDRHGEEKGQQYKIKMSIALSGRKQTQVSINKRIESRRNNGRPWTSEKHKKLMSVISKKLHLDPIYRSKINTLQARKKQSETMKLKILRGEFTPCITNSWTKWKSKVILSDNSIKKFRSTWDATFWYLNQDTKYEKIRIPYFDSENKQHIYIVDFVDEQNKILYEIKPDALKENSINQCKFNVANKWCFENNYQFKIISDEWFKENARDINAINQPSVLKFKQTFFK